MSLYLDSADRTALSPLLRSGLFDGVTTNPLILHRAGLTPADAPAFHDWALDAGAKIVFLQVSGEDTAGIVADGRRLAALSDRVIVKVPATAAGLAASAQLSQDGVPTLVTAVYHASQALLARAAGARYIAPYLGRMTNAGRDGLREIGDMQRILQGSDCEILVASIKSIDDLVDLAARGVPSYTVSIELAQQMLNDELTMAASAEFESVTRESVG